MADIVDILYASKIDANVNPLESTYSLPHGKIFDDILIEAKMLSQEELKEKINNGEYVHAILHILKGLLKGRNYSKAANIVNDKYKSRYLNQNNKTVNQNNYSTKEEAKTNTINEIVNV